MIRCYDAVIRGSGHQSQKAQLLVSTFEQSPEGG